jgi:HAMP domain-containing protein
VGTGTILSTSDGGTTWVAATYRRYPAPWFYLAGFLILAAALTLAWRLRGRAVERLSSIEDKGESDQPIASVEQDRLGFADLAKGLARYLRNAATKPPLTIALNAPWGRGKSSVMQMLRSELAQAGGKTVWFNAWHHQKEEISLAALLGSIYQEALPPWLSLLGLRFRARLLFQRFRRHPKRWLLCFAVLLFPLWHLGRLLGGLPDLLGAESSTQFALERFAWAWRGLLDHHVLQKLSDGNLGGFFSGLLAFLLGKPEHALDFLAVLLCLAGVLALVLYGLRAFPDSPAVLLASLSSRFKLSEAEAQTAFRQSFREHFSDVCQALLPRALVVFIDDLDRCEPCKTAEMLEAVNYLVDSGPCFVVLGLARDVVEAQLAHHYKELADARHALRTVDGSGQDAGNRAADVDRDRVGYARDYLRKLINLEVYIPSLDVARVRRLLGIEERKKPDPPGWRERVVREYEATSGWLGRGGWRAVAWALAVPLLCWGFYSIWVGAGRWSQSQLALLQQGREEAKGSLLALHEAERRANVALEWAKGRERAAATRAFEGTGISLPGLRPDLPLERRPVLAGPDPCDENLHPVPPPGAPPAPARRGEKRPRGEAHAPAPAAVPTQSAILCWQECAKAARAAEEQAIEAHKQVEAGESAKARDDFRRLNDAVAAAGVAATRAEAVARLDRVRPPEPKPGPAKPPGPESAKEEKRPSEAGGDEAVVLRHAPKPRWPSGLPALAIVVLVLAFVRVARAGYVIHDDPEFLEALKIWAPVVGAESSLAAPREVKRFQNKARYFAMRLRPMPERKSWLGRLLLRRAAVTETGRTKLSEPHIVALTALHHVHPEWFAGLEDPRDLFARVRDGSPDIGKEIKEAHSTHWNLFRSWPLVADIEPFFAVVGEYVSQAPAPARAEPPPPPEVTAPDSGPAPAPGPSTTV